MHQKSRPKFLDLTVLGSKMAITAKISILHRISGVLLFVAIPLILYILHKSLVSPSFYATLYGVTSSPIIKLIYVVLIGLFIYHLCSGVRYLFLDIHKGINIKTAKITAKVVIVSSIMLTIVLGILIW